MKHASAVWRRGDEADQSMTIFNDAEPTFTVTSAVFALLKLIIIYLNIFLFQTWLLCLQSKMLVSYVYDLTSVIKQAGAELGQAQP